MSATPGLDAYLAALPGRCSHGVHLATQRGLCPCTPAGGEVAPGGPRTAPVERAASPCSPVPEEWAIFRRALTTAAVDGVVHQAAMRPLLRGQDAPKHVGTLYRRAKAEGLITDTGRREPSNDTAGRNTDKLDRVYALVPGRAPLADTG